MRILYKAAAALVLLATFGMTGAAFAGNEIYDGPRPSENCRVDCYWDVYGQQHCVSTCD